MKNLEKKIKKYYKNYYHIQLGLPNWIDWVNFRLKEEEFELKRIDRLEKLLGRLGKKKIWM